MGPTQLGLGATPASDGLKRKRILRSLGLERVSGDRTAKENDYLAKQI